MTSALPSSAIRSRPESSANIQTDTHELASEITKLAGHIHAANYRFLVLVAEFDRLGGWQGAGVKSCAHWLEWQCGLAIGAAREKLRVARSLEHLPLISRAFGDGKLSYSMVRALTREATAANEDFYLQIAEHGTASHVEKLIRQHRRAQKLQHKNHEQHQQEARSVTWYLDDDGMWVVKARLPAVEGEQLIKALNAIVDVDVDADVDVDVDVDVDAEQAALDAAGASGHVVRNITELDATTDSIAANPVWAFAGDQLDKQTAVRQTSTGQQFQQRPCGEPPPEGHSSTAMQPRGQNHHGRLPQEQQSKPGQTQCEVDTHPPHDPDNLNPGPPGGETRKGDKNVPAGTFSEIDEPQRSFPQRRADALMRMAEHYLASANDGITTLKGAERTQVMLHVDIHTLRRNTIDANCRLEHDNWLHPDTAKRLSCDASLVTVLEDEKGNVLNIGRRSRIVPPHIRRALDVRDSGCRYPGCCSTRYVDAHHIQHWADGGETTLDNLVMLCRFHHRALHHGEFDVSHVGGEEEFRFTSSCGKTIDAMVRPETRPLEDVPAGTFFDMTDAEPRVSCGWDGGAMDYDIAVQVLMNRETRSDAQSGPSGL